MPKPVCAVVGIGPGNGAALSRRFAAAGYAIAMMSRETAVGAKLATERGPGRAYACDVGDAASVKAAFDRARSELGEIDVLIFNAGSGSWGTIDDITPEAFEAAWRVNALGLFLASQQVIPAMKQNGAGAIVVVGATASRRGMPRTTAF